MEVIRLGSRTLQPRRQLLVNGRREAIGKRALDILSVLAEANGGIVTKDELLEAVWPGVTVEENALQVHVVALRKALGPEADRLKTIRGVGYQLEIDGEPADAAVPAVEPPAIDEPPPSYLPSDRLRGDGQSRTRLAVLAVLAFTLVAVTVVVVFGRPSTPSTEVVRIEPLKTVGGEPAKVLAQTLNDRIAEVFTQSRIPIVGDKRTGLFSTVPEAARVLRGSIAQDERLLKVSLTIADVASGTTLWSQQFEGSLQTTDSLATEASAAAVRTMYYLRDLDTNKGVRVKPEIVALYLRGVELNNNRGLFDEATPREIFEEVVARAPELASGHSLLALALVGEAGQATTEQAKAQLLSNARREARRAISIDPVAGAAAFDALYFLSRIERPTDIATAEDLLLEGLRSAPDYPWLAMRECQVLYSVGRGRDAVPYCQQGLALFPFAEPIAHAYPRALLVAGEERRAEAAILRAVRNSPTHGGSRDFRFELAAFGGRPAEALALLRNPATAPSALRGRELGALTRYLEKAGHWDARERRDLADEFAGLARRGDIVAEWAIMALATLGDNDAAFELLHAPQFEEYRVNIASVLFRPVSAPLRADPRFWGIAARLGLVRYWTKRNRWPDMCGREFELNYCKAQAARALAIQ